MDLGRLSNLALINLHQAAVRHAHHCLGETIGTPCECFVDFTRHLGSDSLSPSDVSKELLSRMDSPEHPSYPVY